MTRLIPTMFTPTSVSSSSNPKNISSNPNLNTTTNNPKTPTTATTSKQVSLLILGAGWTSTFLIPLLKDSSISHAATSTTGHDSTIPFRFDPSTSTLEDFATLPTAHTVLITFPLVGKGQSKKLVDLYLGSREESEEKILFVQLGSTGIFTAPHWNTHKSSYDASNSRAIAEDELISLSTSNKIRSTVLNLAGLYGPPRDPKTWLPRVVRSRADVAGKKALHLVHGKDVARAIVGAHENAEKVCGQRWIVDDLHVYDWWELIFEWSGIGSGRETLGIKNGDGKNEEIVLKEVVLEEMREQGVRALPRGPEGLGRVLDGRDFWEVIQCWPSVGRVT